MKKFDVHYKDSVGSTMDLARDYIQNHDSCDYIVLQGGEQTGGRGRRGNQWLSPYGNLYQSIVLKPHTNRQYWGQLSFVMAVALAQACFEIGIGKNHVQLKWPNDVLIGGQKLAGILIEVDNKHVVIGTGVNIEHCPDNRSKIHDFSTISINEFRDVFLEKIAQCYAQWEKDGFAPIRDQWLGHAYKLKEPILARINTAEFEGVFEGLDLDGTLLLREKDGFIRNINAGEIIACS